MENNDNKERILKAALTVVKNHTISGTRMHLIAEQVDMLQSNLHYYFKTKDELMLALQEKVLEECTTIRTELLKETEDTLEATLDVFIKQKQIFILEKKEYDYAEMDFWQQGRINEKIKKGFQDSFHGWRSDIGDMLDKYVPHLPENIRKTLPALTVSMLEGATIQYLIDEESMDLEEYFRAGKDLLLTTVRPYQ